MNIALRKDALTETHKDVQKLIYKCVWAVKDRFTFDFNELLSEANMIFLEAYDTYDEDKGGFSTWLTTSLTYRLSNYCKEQIKKNHLLESYLTNGEFKTECTFDFDFFAEIIQSAKADTKEVMAIIFDPPKEIEKKLSKRNNYKQITVSMLREYLKQQLGWSRKRIIDSFLEIRSIIND